MTDTSADKPAPFAIINGEPWWNYIYDYRFDGADYSFHIPARSKAEADARLSQMSLARYEGKMHGNPIPANPATGIWARLFVWWRNRSAQLRG